MRFDENNARLQDENFKLLTRLETLEIELSNLEVENSELKTTLLYQSLKQGNTLWTE